MIRVLKLPLSTPTATIVMVKQTLVLYPSPAIGHLISMVELGKLILKHHPSLSITILITNRPYKTAGSTTPYIKVVSQTTPSINFHHLPTVAPPLDSYDSANHEALTFEFLKLNNMLVRKALQTISTHASTTVKAFIIDMFCSAAFEVGQNLRIPTFFFYTSGLSAFAVYLYFPTIFKAQKNFEDVNSQLYVPGVPPILASDLPKVMLERETNITYQGFLHSSTTMRKSQGIIVNSFASLEPRALEAIREGLCVPDNPTPPVFCIGPLVDGHRQDAKTKAIGYHCLNWLDSQPYQSVVYLCFGSLGLFSKVQLTEIAYGLEKSAQRFLWVVRSPPIEEKTKRLLAPPPEPDLTALLPHGFLDRTKDRGLVLKSWAPQVEILNHDSVGGFVTHCGWNSVLEAICAGVPMVGWPLYAEQRKNRVFMVDEMKIALPMEESKDGFVNASEVEKRIRQLMDSDLGTVVREQTLRMSAGAKAALNKGGSSLADLSQFVLGLLVR